MIKAITATVKNIATINRRIKTISKLFGYHSAEYEAFTTTVTEAFDLYQTATGIVQIRNNKTNRKSYQKLSALAKKVRNMPIQVLQRKAKQQREKFDDYREITGDYEMKFHDYTWFTNTVTDLASEVYGLVDTAYDMGLVDSGEDGYRQALSMAFHSEAYRHGLYDTIIKSGGEKDLFSHPQINLQDFIHIVEDYTEVEYDTDPYTGMVIAKDGFYDDLF